MLKLLLCLISALENAFVPRPLASEYPHHTSCNASRSPPPDHTTVISLSVSSRYWRSFATCSSTERRDEPPSVSRDSADFS